MTKKDFLNNMSNEEFANWLFKDYPIILRKVIEDYSKKRNEYANHKQIIDLLIKWLEGNEK